MRIGLAAYRCENGNTEYNLKQIERALAESCGQVDLICFGEAFVQGFDSLTWNYGVDKETAIDAASPEFRRLCELSSQYGVAILTGYIERSGTASIPPAPCFAKGRRS